MELSYALCLKQIVAVALSSERRKMCERIECEECGEKWTEQELDSYSWHCLECGHKIGD